MEHPEAWEDDGFTDYDDDDIATILRNLGCLAFEVQALADACKREAWVREHVARYEDKEDNLIMARYWWRRTERLRAIAKALEETSESGEES